MNVTELLKAYKAAWDAACRHDRIDPRTTKFAVLSNDNPYWPELNRLAKSVNFVGRCAGCGD